MTNRNPMTMAGAMALAVLTLGTLAFALVGPLFPIQIGADNNAVDNAFVQPQDPAESGGGRDQTQQFGDVMKGTRGDDLMIGRLGTDILFGANGNDVMVGGTEHFNPQNRDRAFGAKGDDVFLWAPGDGSDRFEGGPGLDTVIFGLIGETDENGNVEFSVKNDGLAGDVFINPDTGLPLIDVTNSPGFCEIVDSSFSPEAADELAALGLDHLIRFLIRAEAQDGSEDGDNGLRVTLHLRDVEYLVCTSENGGFVEAFDLRDAPATIVPLESLPEVVNQMVR